MDEPWVAWHYEVPIPVVTSRPTMIDLAEMDRFRKEMLEAFALTGEAKILVEPSSPEEGSLGSPLEDGSVDIGGYADVSTMGKVLDL